MGESLVQQRNSLLERLLDSVGLSGNGTGPLGQMVRISRKFRQRWARNGVCLTNSAAIALTQDQYTGSESACKTGQ